MKTTNLITLTTDFGTNDPFVGQMKGAILMQNRQAKIIDLTHAIPPYDILSAAVTIHTSYAYFPAGCVHLVIVDPDVGSQRNILAVMADNHFFIAPDNGIITFLVRDKSLQAVHRVENSSLFPKKISFTFHGRDIMAPLAAALAGGMPIQELGPICEPNDSVLLDIPKPFIKQNAIEGQVLHIDHFGNIRTTINTATLSQFQPADFSHIEVKEHRIIAINTTYAQQPPGKLLALIDSAGYLELAVNKGNAEKFTGCVIGDPVTVFMTVN